MRLELFKFIDQTVALYKEKLSTFQYVEEKITLVYNRMFNQRNDSLVSFRTRIKNEESLKEKLIRNQYYLTYKTAKEAIENMPDIIGITMQCRFIRNEAELYKYLFLLFEEDGDLYRCKLDPHIYLNLRLPQPQLQRNGFTIYRLDGCYILGNEKINYELQIKSLVHSFWSEIEHEIVYKNPDFHIFETFNRNMLSAIRDNLDVVDRQLEIMYDEISSEAKNPMVGLDEKGFKSWMARSINELVVKKTQASLNFATDFKKSSSTLAHYIYIHDFINGKNNRAKMMYYIEQLHDLTLEEIDYKEKIILEGKVNTKDVFVKKMCSYFIQNINRDFQWHLFFATLFALQNEQNVEVLESFTEFYMSLLIQHSWYKNTFLALNKKDAEKIRNELTLTLADTLIHSESIKIIFEDRIYIIMKFFREYVEALEIKYNHSIEKKDIEEMKNDLYHKIMLLI
ncbi:MAG: hypothetical protein IJ875_01205 [Solobacterium sp.]|nr:hypothetical protein [Solobacterium sp.]